MSKQEELDQQKAELINDLVATSTVMEEMWNYHPDNPNKKNIVKEYKILEEIKFQIEKELSEME
jgi:hypothetical protein